MIKKLILMLVLIFVFSACATPTPQQIYYVNDVPQEVVKTPTPKPESPTLNLDYGHKIKVGNDIITRFVDVDASVVCYMYRYYRHNSWNDEAETGGGISCLPLSETALEY